MHDIKLNLLKQIKYKESDNVADESEEDSYDFDIEDLFDYLEWIDFIVWYFTHSIYPLSIS